MSRVSPHDGFSRARLRRPWPANSWRGKLPWTLPAGAFCLVLVAGCATEILKGYEGPEKPLEQLAIIEPHTSRVFTEWLFQELPRPEVRCPIHITGLDGKTLRMKEPKLAVEPGPHAFDIDCRYEDATTYDHGGRPIVASESKNFILKVELRAGHSYRIEGFLTRSSPRELGIKITDVTDGRPVEYSVDARNQ